MTWGRSGRGGGVRKRNFGAGHDKYIKLTGLQPGPLPYKLFNLMINSVMVTNV